ncbi:MAG: ABC transporter substrate-binding protein [Deltaproteobacteria bacterium]|nr:ABC transporter substrate-binding protein [Deltaproteobacteria bacterium]
MQRAWLIILLCAVLASAGRTEVLEPLPGRIISLAPSITKELYDLGLSDKLIGVTCYRPETASSKEIVGSLTKLNFEKIISLKPDLILASKDSNTKSDIEKLNAWGLYVVVLDGCESFECMCREFERLGSMLGKAEKSRVIIDEVGQRMQYIRSSISTQKPLKIFWQTGTNPLVSISDNTFAGEYLRFAGCENIFADVPVRYPRINIEEVLVRNPDVIFIVSEMGSNITTAPWDNMPEISAVKNARIYTISADLVCQPTPRMFLNGFEAVIKSLYPGVL